MGGEIRGKTKLQKTAYFLGVLTDMLEDLGYQPHFYGPYSAEIAGAAARLRALGFARQTVVGGGAFDQAGFEVARYDLRLTEEGYRVAEDKAKVYGKEWDKVRKGAEILTKAPAQDHIKLSVAAKTYFMLGQKKGLARAEDFAALAGDFGWRVTPTQVKEAAGFLKSLGLVRLE
jgi:hypothetical protein